MQTNLKDKVVLVTGGSRGIGQALVRRFAEEGAVAVFTYAANEAAAHELAAEVMSKGGRASAVRVDVRDADGMASTIDMIESEHGRLDVLVNNAGIIRDTLLMTMESQDWSDVLETNLTGVFNAIKPVSRLMMRQRRGAIVNLSSIAATRPGRGHANYAASKGGIEALTKALAVELAPKNIRVNCVAPGMIETDMSKDVRQLAGDQILSRILLKRYGTPTDIANAVVFLASDLSAYVTGTVLHVDGGIAP